MPELVACPSCGCRVQISEARLGTKTRCIACGATFLAVSGPAQAQQEVVYPLRPLEEESTPTRLPLSQRGRPRQRIPLCPACHRPVGWETPDCPYCGHLFDPLDVERPHEGKLRMDGEGHRGELLNRMGGVSLTFGCLTILLGPVGVLLAWGLGIPTLVMANRDLERMKTGLVDPAGRPTTDMGRSKAAVGVLLAAVLGLFWGMLLLNSFGW